MTLPVFVVKNEPHESAGLIGEVLKKHGVAFDSFDLKNGDAFPDPAACSALVVLGGPASANDETPLMKAERAAVKRALEIETPFLGICLGLQVLVKAAGGKVLKSPVKEVGFRMPDGRAYEVQLTFDGATDPLFHGFRNRAVRVFQLHGETVELPVQGFQTLGVGSLVPLQVVRGGRRAYGIQCHFELTPELFELWLEKDADLRQMHAASLRRDFNEIEAEYRETGIRLAENFFKLAGVL